MSTQPQVLPWHKTVGIYAADRARCGLATSANAFAELVAEHDPSAAPAARMSYTPELQQAMSAQDTIASLTFKMGELRARVAELEQDKARLIEVLKAFVHPDGLSSVNLRRNIEAACIAIDAAQKGQP